MNPPTTPSSHRRLAVAVRGVVQGVGFRPFVYQTARACGLTGWVRNEAGMVRIEVEGDAAALDRFLDALRHAGPPQARIDHIDVVELGNGREAIGAAFQIRASSAASAPRPAVPADLATCPECLAEIRDPRQRRYGYPFTNCTNCGPRWSIIRRLPYDRPNTSMADFALCPACRAEYVEPGDRRFHAQPVACPHCGPALELLDAAGRAIAGGPAALEAAAQAVLAGQIVAVKGLGGFQLLADATNADAVATLRQRKHRPHRPFALMFSTIDEMRRYCRVSDVEAEALASPAAPILLLRRIEKAAAGESHGPQPVGVAISNFKFQISNSASLIPNLQSLIPDVVAPGNPCLGAMLPYTPLHYLLLAAIGRPAVCTSGNLAEEPMAIDVEDALERLGAAAGIADLVLTHNRPIVRPVDDSVARVDAEGLQILRRARGYAPLPVTLAFSGPTVLAVGGHLKNTVALALGSQDQPLQVVMSPHVGDLDNRLSVEVFHRAIDDLLDFFQATPEAVACDLHPDYASTRRAEQLAARWDVPLVRVQHHHAHVAACAAEHALEGPVLGLAWDGTGYGTDGTVWGGEALVCDGPAMTRLAHLRTFPLPSGDRAVREPRRSALGMLYEIFGNAPLSHRERAGVRGSDADSNHQNDESFMSSPHPNPLPAGEGNLAAWFSRAELQTLLAALRHSVNAPRTSSMGRLFDAAAALCGLPSVVTFEGQAAMALEFAADAGVEEAYPLPLGEGTPAVADWEPLLRSLLADREAGMPVGQIAARFHNALAELAVALARRAGLPRVVLSGGCFQNALLTDCVRRRLVAAGFSVYTHRRIPPGDGGIALGQAVVAAMQTQGTFHVSGHSR